MEMNENKSSKKSKDFLILIIIIGIIFLFIVGLFGGALFLYVKYAPKSSSLNNKELFTQNKQVHQIKKNEYVKKQEKSFPEDDKNKSLSVNENYINKKNIKDILKNKKSYKSDNLISKTENTEILLSQDEKAELILTIKESNDSNPQIVKNALNKLKNYPNSNDAYECVKSIVLNHKDNRVRIYALTVLNVFQAFDINSVYNDILFNLKDEQFGGYVINSVFMSKIEGYEEVLIKALNSTYNDIRYRALFYLSKFKNPLFIPVFMDKALNEKVWEIRDMALFALSLMQAKETLPILYSLLSSNNSNEKEIGFSYLKMFELNNEMKVKLSEYKNDSVIGKKVIIYLNNK